MKILLALLAFVAIVPALAQVRPTPGTGDPRLQTIVYDPEQVVQLPVSSGYQLMVSFASGERIETIALGNGSAWQVTANKRGDYLFIKNPGSAPVTNMTVVTDARVYNFVLTSAGDSGADLVFSVRFSYPDPPSASATIGPPRIAYRFRLAGARAIRPASITEDGERTTISWPDQMALPAMFRLDDDGQETLVNSEMQDGRFVIAGVPNKLMFRLDRMVATATRVRVRGRRR